MLQVNQNAIGTYAEKVFIVFLIAVMALLVYSRYQYRHIPFERDEGEYAYAGSLLLRGELPYKEAYNMKFPGTYFMYAAMMKVGGENIEAIRVGVLIMLLLTALGVGLIAMLLTQSKSAAWVAAVLMVAINSTMEAEGLMSNAEHFVNLFAVWGMYFLFRFVHKPYKLYPLFISGLLLGTGVIMKQYGYPFCFLGALVLLANVFGKPWRNAVKSFAVFIAGGITPLVLLLLWLWANNLFASFYFLTIQYALAYISMSQAGYGWTIQQVLHSAEPLQYLVGASAILLVITSYRYFSRVLLVWLVLAYIALATGNYFRLHYYHLLYPAIALAVACAYTAFGRRMHYLPGQLVIVVFLVLFFSKNSAVLLAKQPMAVFNNHYQWSMFNRMPDVAKHIDSLIPPTDKLSMIANEPELYFYTHRTAATGYIYYYPVFENHKYNRRMLQQYVSELESNPSRLFVSSNIRGAEATELVEEAEKWREKYLQQYYLSGIYTVTAFDDARYYSMQELQGDTSWKNAPHLEFWMRR